MKNEFSFMNDLKTLISYNSVKSVAEDGAPFGKGVRGALDFFLSVAEKMGFNTVNYDGYAGEVYYGQGEEVGIIGHLDVVPIGDGWTVDPFALTEKDGYLYGRGIADDKGAMLLSLYALKELKDAGVPCNKKFRLFVGCDEESGWQDVEYLKTKTAIPEYGFSPDGDFPVGYAEKGFYFVKTVIPPFKNFGAITGGTVINAVCAFAKVKVKGDFDRNLLKKYSLTEKDGFIESIGVAAHGSQPQKGKNAILPLLEFLRETGEDVGDYIDYLFKNKWGVTDMQNEQGYITFSPDLAKETPFGTEISCDMRIPAPFTVEDAAKRLNSAPFKVEIIDHAHPPVMVAKDGAFVNTLLSAYNAFAESKGTPVSMGGSTFARVFKKGCAFGPEFPNSDFHIHEADERIEKALFFKCYEVYKKAIFDLAALKAPLN